MKSAHRYIFIFGNVVAQNGVVAHLQFRKPDLIGLRRRGPRRQLGIIAPKVFITVMLPPSTFAYCSNASRHCPRKASCVMICRAVASVFTVFPVMDHDRCSHSIGSEGALLIGTGHDGLTLGQRNRSSYQRFLPSITITAAAAASKSSNSRAFTPTRRVVPSQLPSGSNAGLSLNVPQPQLAQKW